MDNNECSVNRFNFLFLLVKGGRGTFNSQEYKDMFGLQFPNLSLS